MNTENQTNEQSAITEKLQQPKPQLLEITNDIGINLHSAGKWSQFLAILGFIGMGFMLLASVAISTIMSFVPNVSSEAFPFPPYLFGLLYFVMALVYLFPVLYLYRFSQNIRQALTLKNQTQLSKAFTNLKSHYKSIGIIMIVFLCLYPIMIIAAVVIGVFAGGSAFDTMPV